MSTRGGDSHCITWTVDYTGHVCISTLESAIQSNQTRTTRKSRTILECPTLCKHRVLKHVYFDVSSLSLCSMKPLNIYFTTSEPLLALGLVLMHSLQLKILASRLVFEKNLLNVMQASLLPINCHHLSVSLTFKECSRNNWTRNKTDRFPIESFWQTCFRSFDKILSAGYCERQPVWNGRGGVASMYLNGNRWSRSSHVCSI